jgi:hypothetical protein
MNDPNEVRDQLLEALHLAVSGVTHDERKQPSFVTRLFSMGMRTQCEYTSTRAAPPALAEHG